MGECTQRRSKYARTLDRLDEKIAELVVMRNALAAQAPPDYDCCGEGDAYFLSLLDLDQAERVYHAVAGIGSEP